MEPETNNNGSNNAKVMIAEDDVSLMEIMSMQLKKKGYNVISATNGKKAVEMVREVTPDILLLDLLMPEMDGFEVLQYMQENDIHVPTMVLTNLGQEQNCDKSKELGAIDCCVKSDTPLNLLATKIEGILKSVGK
mgnify:CR=1 FL=1